MVILSVAPSVKILLQLLCPAALSFLLLLLFLLYGVPAGVPALLRKLWALVPAEVCALLLAANVPQHLRNGVITSKVLLDKRTKK